MLILAIILLTSNTEIMIERIRAGLRKWEWAGLVEEIDTIRDRIGEAKLLGTSAEFDKEGILRIEVGRYSRKATSVMVEFEEPDLFDAPNEFKPPVRVMATQVTDRDIPAASTELHRIVEVTKDGITAGGDLGRHALLGALRVAASQLAPDQGSSVLDPLVQYGQSETQVD